MSPSGYCWKCLKAIPVDAVACPFCGVDQNKKRVKVKGIAGIIGIICALGALPIFLHLGGHMNKISSLGID